MFSDGDSKRTTKQLSWLTVSCPPGGEDLLWAFHALLKESQVEHSSSRRGLDETLSPLIPVVCAELLQSWKALGKTVWFSARAQLGNSGVFCCSWFFCHWSNSAAVHLASHGHSHRFPWHQSLCVGLLKRVERKALWFSPPRPSHQQCSLQHHRRKNRPSAQQLLPPPTLMGGTSHSPSLHSVLCKRVHGPLEQVINQWGWLNAPCF